MCALQGTESDWADPARESDPRQVYPLWFLSSSSSSEVFCDSQRNILKENDIVRFPRLADTYQRIADEGPDVFYNGSMARTIVRDIQGAGAQPRNSQNSMKPNTEGKTSS